MADALQRLYEEVGEQRPVEVSSLVDLVNATWSHVGNPRFKAVLEAWLAMANDPELGSAIGPVVAEFAKLVMPEQIAPSVVADEESRTLYLVARESMLGLALGRAVNGGRPLRHERLVLSRLRDDAARVDAHANGD